MAKRAVTEIYSKLMEQIEARRVACGVPMAELSEWAGIADRSFAKYKHAAAPSGRQATWQTIETLMGTLYPAGYDILVVAKPGPIVRPNDLKAQLLRIPEKMARYHANRSKAGASARPAA